MVVHRTAWHTLAKKSSFKSFKTLLNKESIDVEVINPYRVEVCEQTASAQTRLHRLLVR